MLGSVERRAFGFAADLLDPPEWQAPNRPPLLPHQEPPAGEWDFWLMEGGRGSGKTEGCARYFNRWQRTHPGSRGRIIAPTLGDAVEACIDGPSGLKAIDPEVIWHPSAPGGSKVIWPNGSEALVLGTPTPKDVDRLRAGGNRDIDWWEEFAANPMIRSAKKQGEAWGQNAWDQAWFGLRRGTRPHAIGSTTPRPSPKYKEVRSLPSTVITRATLYDNPYNNPDWRAKMIAAYEGTRLGRQELGGELLEDVEGALWTLDMIESHRVQPAEVPEGLVRIVLGVDPPGGRTDCGIIVCGLAKDGRVFVKADLTAENKPSPATWARKVVRGCADEQGDAAVVERNYGGEMVAHTIASVPAEKGYPAGSTIRIKEVSATRGKAVRAEPAVHLYEQNRVFHVGSLPKLEDELTTWVPDESPDSPNRLDALVWCLYDLVISAKPKASTGKMDHSQRYLRGR